MARENVDVLILATIEGHYSLACCAAHALAKDNLVSRIITFRDPSLPVYRFVYRHRPALLGIIFALYRVPLVRRVVDLRLRLAYTRPLFSLLERYQPRLLLSANYAFEPSIERHRARIRIPYVKIMADPRPFADVVSRTADANCVFDERLAAACRARHPHARVRVTGWLVRPGFAPPRDKGRARERLGLSRDRFTMLIASGWEGTNRILTILPALLEARRPLQLVVACGVNERMRKRVVAMSDRSAGNGAGRVRLVALPFTQDIHRYLQAADLVVGKAGPNMLFETVATHVPFFSIVHVPVLEDGNLDLIREERLGFVEEDPARARRMLRRIVEGPDTLEVFRRSISRMARRNAMAGEALREIVRGLLARGP